MVCTKSFFFLHGELFDDALANKSKNRVSLSLKGRSILPHVIVEFCSPSPKAKVGAPLTPTLTSAASWHVSVGQTTGDVAQFQRPTKPAGGKQVRKFQNFQFPRRIRARPHFPGSERNFKLLNTPSPDSSDRAAGALQQRFGSLAVCVREGCHFRVFGLDCIPESWLWGFFSAPVACPVEAGYRQGQGMQTRKMVVARNTVKENASSKSCRQQKKMTLVADKKATEMITSSAKKQKPGGILSKKKTRDAGGEKNMSTGFVTKEDSQDYTAPIYDVRFGENDSLCALGTIFSPSFHSPKDFCVGISNGVHLANFSSEKDQALSACEERVSEKSRVDLLSCHLSSGELADNSVVKSEGLSLCDEQHKTLGNLSPEVSAIYLAMQHSKLECVDEPSHDPMATDGCEDSDDSDEFDDFDPYLFIKNLPDLSAVVPTFRPMLLPKQTRSCPSTTLVLDLDETLVHSSLDPCDGADFTFPVNFNLREHTIYVRCRPYLKDFMERVSRLFEIIIFTASQSIYAEQLLNVLDPKRRLFRHRVYRESCVFVEGNYVKDLSLLGRDLAHVIIVDNSPQAFGFQVDNGIPIESWFDDRSDRELLSLLPFLESLVGVDDVRPLIAKKFNVREKIAAANPPAAAKKVEVSEKVKKAKKGGKVKE
ncbi:hypothetical protein Taro_043449 [Colocasia esculenta]|uniref:FCP1 homology domain-containing protein n=1 Tax=Colocasia esculenta TaxID=4460 RepID=A0A843X0Q9_COLES|nr:hypothetical protein [Colocasia esculenta]